MSDSALYIAIGIPAFLGLLTAIVGDKIVERVFLHPLLKALTVTSGSKIVQDALGPLLRINTRRITVYHYFSFSGLESAMPLAFGIVQSSQPLTVMYLFLSAFMFGNIVYFVILKRSSFDWWTRMHWRFTMVAASTVFVLGGDQIVSRVILVSSPTVIYAVLMVILFLVLALFVPRYEPGPGGRLKSFSEESGTKWFTIDDVMRNSKIRTLRMTRRELAYNLMKLYDMGELEMGGDVAPEISGREVEQVVTLRFRKPPGQ